MGLKEKLWTIFYDYGILRSKKRKFQNHRVLDRRIAPKIGQNAFYKLPDLEKTAIHRKNKFS